MQRKAASIATYIKCVFIDYKHAHVLGQQFAGMTYKTEMEGEKKNFFIDTLQNT